LEIQVVVCQSCNRENKANAKFCKSCGNPLGNSSIIAKALFERGKTYFDNNKIDKALKDFSEAVRLEPNNPIYQTWLGYAKYHKGYFTDALENFSKAISIEPSLSQAYYWRSKTYYQLANFENAIIDRARYYKLNPGQEPEWVGDNVELRPWYQFIRSHLLNTVLPKLKVSDEKFVGYWPCYLEWGKRWPLYIVFSFLHYRTLIPFFRVQILGSIIDFNLSLVPF
jgi:tetratricopeptide (TPR) repeat protein